MTRYNPTQPFSLWRTFGIERHHQLVLKWLLLTGVVIFVFSLAAYYGLVSRVMNTDRSYISIGITVLYILTTLHCMVQSWFVSRQLNIAGKVAREFSQCNGNITIDGDMLKLTNGTQLMVGVVTEPVSYTHLTLPTILLV